MADGNGWTIYQKLVLDRLERLDGDIKHLRADVGADFRATRAEIQDIRDDEIAKLKVDIAMLKVKAGMWGLGAGLIPAGLITIATFLGGSGG